jgi:hypothetical protein
MTDTAQKNQRAVRKKWGVWDFAWVNAKCNTLPTTGSEAWRAIAESWGRIKKKFVQVPPICIDDARSLSLFYFDNDQLVVSKIAP